MKEGFRQSMDWLHTWLGLVVGWILFFVYLTGTLGYLDTEIDYWMTPEKPFFTDIPDISDQLTLAQNRLEQVASTAQSWTIQLIGGREAHSLDISWVETPTGEAVRGSNNQETLHPESGQAIDNSARATGGGQLLYKMHYNLAYMPLTRANIVIMICSIIMFAAMITGIIVHRNIFRDLFTFRTNKGQRSWLDGHNVLSVTSLPFHLIVTYSGLMFFVYQFTPAVPDYLYRNSELSAGLELYRDVYFAPRLNEQFSPASGKATLSPIVNMLDDVEALWGENKVTSVEVIYPGSENARVIFRPLPSDSIAFPDNSLIFDGVNGSLIESYEGPYIHPAGYADQVLKGLHKGLFAGAFLRILYLFMGVAGTAMIATGLLMWSTKRKNLLRLRHQDSHFGIALVDRLNLATVIGMPNAIAAYFWANRLLPATLATRADWEVHAMFLTMLATLIYPVFRPLEKAWEELLWLAAGLYCLLPVLNLLTTDRHLGLSLLQGDWIMAGFDLTALVCGLIFVIFAKRFQQKNKSALASVNTDKEGSRELVTP